MKIGNIKLSQLLSYLLHPLIIPTLAILALMLRPDLYSIVLPAWLKLWFIAIVFVFTLLIPAAGVLLLFKLNKIYSIELNQRTERTVPLLIASASYMALLFFMKQPNIPPVFLYIVYSATFALLAGLLINMVYKISLHTLGWSALATTLIIISLRMGVSLLLLISIAVILSGFVGYARLKENAHNPAQVYLGYIVGVLIVTGITLLV
jgi:membrane-associated phospholipid phosphatase